jgi:O-antigen/teichoic acid export membrane protein
VTSTGSGLAACSVANASRRSLRGIGKIERARRLLSQPAVYGSLIPGISGLNAVAGLAVPMLTTPTVFAQYALVVTFFQYGLIFDLGASQLADRVVPALLGRGEDVAAETFGQQLLWFRMLVAAGTLTLVAVGIAGFAAAGRLPFDPAAGLLSAFAGLAYMVALGPACIYRARSDRRNYAVSIAALSAGLAVARIGGLALGGIIGCFVALAVWYSAFAGLFMRLMPPQPALRPTSAQISGFAARGSPLFVTSFLWAFYLTANRWIASGVVVSDDFVLFAFGTNILTLLVGALGGLSALWYPAILEAFAREGRSTSRRVARDLILLVAAATLLSAAAAAAAGLGIDLLFPHFIASVTTVRVFLAAVPVLALSSWLMPMSLSAGRRPWIDGVVLYPVALAVLAAAIALLYASFGVRGAAWASAGSALVLTAMQLFLIVDAGVLSVRQSASLLTMISVATAALTLLAGMLP